MTVSDIITLLSLLIAIIAILNEKNRSHLLLKFSLLDSFLFIIAFLLINYFVFYDSCFARGFFIEQLYFDNFGLKNPKHYAYIISLVSLSYFFYKIKNSFYAYSNGPAVFKFYQKLIENDIPFLLELIEIYHKKDIIKYLKTFNEDERTDLLGEIVIATKWQRFNKILLKVIAYSIPISTVNRKNFARSVLLSIMNDPSFMVLAANKQPTLFAEMYRYFNEQTRHGFPQEFVKNYFKQLLIERNFWLIKELKESQNHSFGQPDWFFELNPILGNLLFDLEVAKVNEVWQPFGDAALEELRRERQFGYESQLFSEFIDNQFLWEYRTYQTVQFFYILMIQAIVKNYRYHFWIQYYSIIVKEIAQTLERYKSNIDTIYSKILQYIINNLIHFTEEANKKSNKNIYTQIISTLGQSIDFATRSAVLSEKKDREIVNSFLLLYCNLQENDLTGSYRDELEKVNNNILSGENTRYRSILKRVWENDFDKVKHTSFDEDAPYFTRLKQNLIAKI